MLYKLTDRNFESYRKTKWGPGVMHRAADGPPVLCSPTVIHAYCSPELAALFNPIHADFETPVCWKCPDAAILVDDGMKVGVKQLTTARSMPLPTFSPTVLVRFAIYCAQLLFTNPAWQAWADDWLRGKDRSARSAQLAKSAALKVKNTAGVATRAAAEVAARAAELAGWIAEGAWVTIAESVAETARWTAEVTVGHPAPDFQEFIEKAVREEEEQGAA